MTSEASHTVLITGGSGTVGRYLTSALLSEGYEVRHLSRKANQFGRVRVFRWDPDSGILDPVVFEGVDYIIHLAGANIGEKRWTKRRKKEIKSSRIDSANLIFKIISENNFPVKGFISASAVGYYGSVTSDKIFTEEDTPTDDFPGSLCRRWEEVADKFASTGTRVVKIRTGVVLERGSRPLSDFLSLARLGVFPIFGNGKQYFPWIHIEDLVNIYLKAVRDEEMNGAYNAVAPQHLTQKGLMKALAEALNKPFFHPPVPAFLLKMVLGKMADIVIKGSRVSANKIQEAGYKFLYPDLFITFKKAR